MDRAGSDLGGNTMQIGWRHRLAVYLTVPWCMYFTARPSSLPLLTCDNTEPFYFDRTIYTSQLSHFLRNQLLDIATVQQNGPSIWNELIRVLWSIYAVGVPGSAQAASRNKLKLPPSDMSLCNALDMGH